MSGPHGSSRQPPPPDEEPGRGREDTQPLPVVGPVPPDSAPPVTASAGSRWIWARLAVLAVVLLVVGLAAADAWLASTVQARIAEEAERELGGDVDVDLSGFAVGLRSLTGDVPAAELRGRDVPLPDTAATMSELELSLRDVVVDRDAGRLEAASADVVVIFDEDGVEELIGVLGRIPLVGLELRPGTLRLNVAGFAVADATVEVDGGELVLGLAAPLERLVPGELRVGDFPFDVQADQVTVREGEIEVRGRAAPLVVDGDGGAPSR